MPMKARPSLDKRRRELKLQERRQDKAEKRRLRREKSTADAEASGDAAVTTEASQAPAEGDTSSELTGAPVKEG